MTNAPAKVAFLATEGTEQVEWEQPWGALKAAGANPVLLTPGGGDRRAVQGRAVQDRSGTGHPWAIENEQG